MSIRLAIALCAAVLAAAPSAAGTITDIGDVQVDGSGNLIIGSGAYGRRELVGVTASHHDVLLGLNFGIVGELSIDAGSHVDASGAMNVGGFGQGIVEIRNGSSLTGGTLRVGLSNLFGITDNLVLVSSGSTLSTADTYLLSPSLRSTRVVVEGAGSSWVASGPLSLATSNSSVVGVAVRDGATASHQGISAGIGVGGVELEVSGPGSTWDTGNVAIGGQENGDNLTSRISVLDGAVMNSGTVSLSPEFALDVLVDGAGSQWNVANHLSMTGLLPFGGRGRISVLGGGSLVADSAFLRSDGYLDVLVSGSGSELVVQNELSLDFGQFGPTRIAVESGGRLDTGSARFDARCGDAGTGGCSVAVSGPGSEWRNRGSILVDALAEGAPQISLLGGGALVSDGSLVLTGHSAAMLDQGAIFAPEIDLAGGTLRGVGTVDGFVRNGGRVAPGDTASGEIGTLTLKGDYLQTTAGRLDIQLGGTTSDSEHDVLVVLGTATLGGELALELVNGYVPQLDDTVFVLAAGLVTGGFESFSGLEIGGGLRWAVSYTQQFVRLKAVLVPEPASGALLGLGLAALGAMRSRRSARR